MTLAETLIALTIIGIVAAMTVPNLMQNWKKQERLTQLKVAYSILQNATKMAVALNGHPSRWDYERERDDEHGADQNSSKAYADKYFIPYVKTREAKYRSEYTDYNVYYINTTKKDTIVLYSYPSYSVMLENGMLVHIRANSTTVRFYVDLNGFKGPNMYGNDFFLFKYDIATNSLEPFVNTNNTQLCTTSANNSGNNCMVNSFPCSGKIINNGWQFPDDYPIKKF